MPTESDYYLRGRHDEVRLELVELIHPSFTRHYRFVRNHADGVRVKHEDGTWRNYEYLPLSIKADRSSASINQGFTIGIGDLGGVIPMELDRVKNGSYPTLRPTLNYRVYLTSDLTQPIASALGLEIVGNKPTKNGAAFACKTRELNMTSTGLVYNIHDDPTLRGFI